MHKTNKKQSPPDSDRPGILDPSVLNFHPLSVTPTFEVAAISRSSPEYQEAQLLQVERYTRACMPGSDTYLKYQEIVDVAPQQTIPLVVRRRDSSLPGSLVSTARLEFPSATTIEAIMRFRPDSLSASVLSRGTFAEVGVFATRSDLAWWEVLDVIDTVASAVVQLAEEYGVEWLWLFPRRTMMSLLLAEIPGLLPPYHFVLCPDVVGWNEESTTLQKIRELRMKELPVSPGTLPILIQITPAQWVKDLKERLALREQRWQRPDLPRLLQTAMRQAHRQMDTQVVQLHAQISKGETAMLKASKKVEPSAPMPGTSITAGSAESPTEPENAPDEQEKQGFLPFAVSKQGEASYLRQVVDQGGEIVSSYKTLSYDLLQLEPGVQVLDVGCGIGADLPALADRVGEAGLVVGLDHDPDLLRTAKGAIAGRINARVVMAEAHEMPFPNRSFDRVRADRVLQYIPELAPVLAEMWRVLRPGGMLTLIEPDWKAIVLFPGSPAGGDDDHTWSAVVQLCQRRLSHALVGRQLAALLKQPSAGVWEQVQAQVVAYTLTSWPMTDAVLQISNLAQALAQEEPARADEINAWLQAIEAAALRGEFLACVPLFFAHAHKAGSK
jgi:ubiquinone/menaquinone biosynthesis C-methylase UbiE